MTNYSRTTLRELKKRYLNVLKKCLLANLLAFSFMLPAGAETASEDRLVNSGEKTYTQGVTFKDLEINGSSGAITNSGSITFGGLATFDGNKAITTGGNSYGGAIHNSGTITFDALATFDGNTAIATSGNAFGGAINNGGASAVLTFNVEAQFKNNKATATAMEKADGSLATVYAQGGAIYNYKSIAFDALATFEGNSATATGGTSYGGAIHNSGANAVLSFNNEAQFKNNTATATAMEKVDVTLAAGNILGSAIYNYLGTITFSGFATFEGNTSSATGGNAYSGAIRNEGANEGANAVLSFKDGTQFKNNTATATAMEKVDGTLVGGNAYGGAISNHLGSITFGGLATFEGNSATATGGNSQGGAIYNNASITFGGLATFDGNSAIATGGTSYGGAFRNNGGSVIFEDTDNNAETPAVPNITYGMTFKGDTLFTGNKAESETGNSYGGAIFNTGYMLLSGENTFGGYEVDKNGDYVLDSEGNKISLGNEAKYGGAIYNTGGKKEGDVIAYGMTLGKSTFMGNTVLSSGGVIYNTGYMNFTDETLFEGNESISKSSVAYGSAINNSGVIKFEGDVEFKNNLTEGYKGVVATVLNQKQMEFLGDVIFSGNKIKSENDYAHGGALSNQDIIVFNGHTVFENNSVELKNGGAQGGAIRNSETGTLTFNSSFEFSGNKDISRGIEKKNDIYNVQGGIINFAHGVDENNNPLIGSLDGGITNNGIINKTGVGTFILGDEMVNSGRGTFNQSAGLTIAHADHFLTGTNNITGGELRVHGANMSNLKATVGGDALLTFLSTSTSEIEMKLGENVSVAGDVKFGADESVGTAKYHLIDDIEAKKIIIENADVTTENETFEGTYVMGENVTLNMQDGDTADSVSFANLTGSANLKIDADIVNGANGLELVTDKIATNSDASLNLALTDVLLSESALDNGLSESYTATVMTGGTLNYGSEKALVATDIYSYEVSGANNQITIDAVKFNEDSDVMKSVAEFDGDAAFNMTIGGDSYGMKSDVVMTKNTKSIVGKGKETSTLTAKKITIDGATLNVENVSVSGENQLIDVASGRLNVTTAKVDNIKNAGTITLNTAEVSELENSGTLTANSSEIGEFVNEKDAEVTGGKVAKVTNNGELTVTGATITELMNEQEAEVTGGELETVTNKEKGMLSLSAGLRAGTVTNEGELTLDAVTVADLTNSASLKTNGSTVQKLVNEQEAELTASTVEDLTNTGKMTAKDLTLKGALKGTGTATLSGKLVADDIFKSENKIISDGMEVSENIQKMELADLEIKDGTTLDIGTREVTAKEVSVGDKATLQVTLNNFDEHGTMKADKIEAGEGAGVHLVLGEKFEGGVFDVFKGTKGAGDLEVKHNNLYNVIEVEEGKYSFMTKDTEALQESLGATKEEVSIADAMTKGTSTNAAFNKMQSEMLIALQSLKTETVAKAKKALSAVGAKEQPIEQSVASEHLVALQNVVQAELHGTGVGRAGGDMDPRAKVYIKGLYDRTKSSMGEGFRARSKGAVLGVQSEVTDTLTLGVGYATSQTTAKEDLRRTEVDTNTGFISAHYQPNAWWVSGLATFSRGEYEEEKQVLSSTGKASYDVDSWGAQVMTGYDIKRDNAIITPEVGMRYLSVKQEGYTDTLGTTVSGTQSDYLTALVGVKGTWDMGVIRPTAGVTVGYDVISDDVSALNTLANGASYTVNGEALDRLSTGVSLGVEADLGDRTTLKLEYSGTFRKEYADHSGMLKLEVKF